MGDAVNSVGDVTGDGIEDVGLSRDFGWANVLKGHSGAWNASYNWWADLEGSGEMLRFYTGVHQAIANWDRVMNGDVNHDGVQDVILTASRNAPDGNGLYAVTPYGSVYVLFGGPSLASRDLEASPPDGTDGLRVDCPYPNGYCQAQMSWGDINGDGIADITVASTNGSVTGSNEEGWAYVLYGKASGWPATYDLSSIK